MSRSGRSVREIATRIVYWGPRGSGKTQSLRAVADRLEPGTCGPLLTPSEEGERTVLMDFLSVELGALDGIPLRLHLVGLPGDDRLGENTVTMLRGADGFVFVADSAPDRRASNRASLESLRRHLVAIGEPDLPVVLQFNRRDVSGAVATERLASDLAPGESGDPWFETVATEGTGVIEALTAVAARVVGRLSAAAEERSGA